MHGRARCLLPCLGHYIAHVRNAPPRLWIRSSCWVTGVNIYGYYPQGARAWLSSQTSPKLCIDPRLDLWVCGKWERGTWSSARDGDRTTQCPTALLAAPSYTGSWPLIHLTCRTLVPRSDTNTRSPKPWPLSHISNVPIRFKKKEKILEQHWHCVSMWMRCQQFLVQDTVWRPLCV